MKPGWGRWRFDQIAVNVNDRVDDPKSAGVDRYVGLEHLDSDSLRIRRWGTPEDVEATKLRFRAGDIIFGRRRAYQRKLALADFDGICSAHAMVLRAKPEVVQPEFLPFFLQSDVFMERAQAISVGSLSPTVNWKTLAGEEFELPPLMEQRQLVSLLAGSEQLLAALWEATNASDATARALREHIFVRRQGRHPLFPLSKAVASSAYGPRFSAQKYLADGPIRTIRTTDIPEDGKIVLETAPAADVPPNMVSEHELKPGDFLISRTGFTSGRAAVFGGAPDGKTYIPAAFLIRLRLDPTILRPYFLLEFLQSTPGRNMVQRLQRGTQQLNISGSQLVAQHVPMPSVDEQDEMVARLTHLAEGQRVLVARTQYARGIKSSLLERL